MSGAASFTGTRRSDALQLGCPAEPLPSLFLHFVRLPLIPFLKMGHVSSSALFVCP